MIWSLPASLPSFLFTFPHLLSSNNTDLAVSETYQAHSYLRAFARTLLNASLTSFYGRAAFSRFLLKCILLSSSPLHFLDQLYFLHSTYLPISYLCLSHLTH